MTKRFRISSKAGVDHGVYESETKAEALLAMHRDAGYDADAVWIKDGRLHFADASYREMCGDVDDWDIREVPLVMTDREQGRMYAETEHDGIHPLWIVDVGEDIPEDALDPGETIDGAEFWDGYNSFVREVFWEPMRIILDNGGSITLQLGGTWAHCYDSNDQQIKQCAFDLHTWLRDGHTDRWEGHEPEMLYLDPTPEQIANGNYRVVTDVDDLSTEWDDDSEARLVKALGALG